MCCSFRATFSIIHVNRTAVLHHPLQVRHGRKLNLRCEQLEKFAFLILFVVPRSVVALVPFSV